MRFHDKLRAYIQDVYGGKVLPCSRACGFKRGTMADWLDRGSVPGLDKLQQLASTTGIHITYWACDAVDVMPTAKARLWSQWLVGLITGEAPSGIERAAQADLIERTISAAEVLLEDLGTLCRIQHTAIQNPDAAQQELQRVEAARQSVSPRDHRKRG